MFRNSQQGSAILIAMIVVLAIVGLTGSFLVTTFSYHSYQKADASKKQAEYLAIEASERLRQQLYTDYRNNGISLTLWLNNLASANQAGFAYKMADGNLIVRPAMNPQPYGAVNIVRIPEWEAAQKFTNDATVNLDPFDATLNGVFMSQSAWVSAVSAPNTPNRWIEVEGFGAVQGAKGNVIRAVATQRLAFGSSNIFTNALLTKTVNCMGCHLQVRGDIGTLSFFRPGWGTEGVDGGNSGDGSFVYGNMYSAAKATDTALKQGASLNYFLSNDGLQNLVPYAGSYYDARRVEAQPKFEINGLEVTKHPSENVLDEDLNGDGFINSLDIETGRIFTTPITIGNRLPHDKDGDGERDFPYIDPQVAETGAVGSVQVSNTSVADGSYIYEIPLGQTFVPGGAQSKATINNDPITGSPVTGSLVLVGTYADPIQLNGDIYAQGDIMIKGYVQGQGAVYAGRNVYILGNVLYKNPPSDYRKAENDPTFVDSPDNLAQADVAAGVSDELRIAAANTIVIGDFTYKNTAGTSFLPISQRQGQDFFTAQFNLITSSTSDPKHGHFQKGTGQELVKEQLTPSGPNYLDSKGNIIPSQYVTRISTSNNSTKGDVLSSGGTPFLFTSTSKEKILNTDLVVKKDSSTSDVANAYYDAIIEPVRISATGTSSHWITEDQTRTLAGTESLTYNSWRGVITGTNAQRSATLQLNGFTSAEATSIVNAAGNYNGGNFYVDKSGDTYRVVRDTATPLTSTITAVSRIDAFLYASKRVAGKVSGKNLVINGGIIGETVGILAPGRKKESWMNNSRYNTPLSATTISSLNGELNGKFTINYDFRLRNGGGGFSLLSGDPGRRISFSVR